ncbi:hypothetical protein K1719_036440 [Acacia pycnantha]|nr:hypothetical protein K1719_036440 [Acacia pycnantha]
MSNYFHSHSLSCSRKINPCAVSFKFYIFNNHSSIHQPSSSSSCSNIFASIIHILLNFLRIQSSGTSPSPFEIRPLAFMVSVGCSVAYYLASSAKFMFPDFSSQFGVLMSVFGSLAISTLISLILKLPWWCVVLSIIFVGGIILVVNRLHGVYGNTRPKSRVLQPLLPLHI